MFDFWEFGVICFSGFYCVLVICVVQDLVVLFRDRFGAALT